MPRPGIRHSRLAALLIVLAVYPAGLLGYVWYHCWSTGLEGGKNGPLDAYRHTLSSAMLAYITTPSAVGFVTRVMEFRDRPTDLMDRHNNAISAEIGEHAHSLDEIEPLVRARIEAGTIDARTDTQATWLPPQQWRTSFFW